MSCKRPVDCYKAVGGGITFSRKGGYVDQPLKLPCGWCVGCRLDKTAEWAVRCCNEAQLHRHNCFLTLTYGNDNLPPGGSVRFKDFQDFLKRLRKAVAPLQISFFHCGEYGENLKRPHYHALIFGYDFPDKKPWKKAGTFRSPLLEKLWTAGYSTIGTFTPERASYVAGYCMKKINGDRAEKHYQAVDPDTGEIYQLAPEYITMSRNPAIGLNWYKRFASDLDEDFALLKGKQVRVPRYYDRLLARTASGKEHLRLLKLKRIARAAEPQNRWNTSPERLAVREEVQQAGVSLKKRNLE